MNLRVFNKYSCFDTILYAILEQLIFNNLIYIFNINIK